jgi:hypothetical protein
MKNTILTPASDGSLRTEYSSGLVVKFDKNRKRRVLENHGDINVCVHVPTDVPGGEFILQIPPKQAIDVEVGSNGLIKSMTRISSY